LIKIERMAKNWEAVGSKESNKAPQKLAICDLRAAFSKVA